MGYTIAQKIIKEHLVSGEMRVGTEIGLRIDQTLTQDATGTMAYLQFEATLDSDQDTSSFISLPNTVSANVTTVKNANNMLMVL